MRGKMERTAEEGGSSIRRFYFSDCGIQWLFCLERRSETVSVFHRDIRRQILPGGLFQQLQRLYDRAAFDSFLDELARLDGVWFYSRPHSIDLHFVLGPLEA